MNRAHIPVLIERYTLVLAASNQTNKSWITNLNSLRLAESAFVKEALNTHYPEHPLQILVLGPTQAGKSTLTNLILDAQAAGISALAGFTVHAQGFACHCSEDELHAVSDAFKPMQRVAVQDITTATLDSFVLEAIAPGSQALIKKGVVWDSPDFDSIEALGYRHAVLQTAAMADIIILAVSKDKYADKSVWDMLALLAPLAKPMLICINKLDASDQQTVITSFQQRHEAQFEKSAPSIVAIPFIKEASDNTIQSQIPGIALDTLKQAIQQLLGDFDRASQVSGAKQLLETHWQDWVQPIDQENIARDDWDASVAKALDNAVSFYQRSYLDDPNKNDTFNRALAELLTLLEIPGIAGALSKTRELVTWPARKLLGFGKTKLKINTEISSLDQEKSVLKQMHQQLQNELQGYALLQQQDQPENSVFWRAISQTLRENKQLTSSEYDSGIRAYQDEFAPRIDDAAKRLYSKLEQQPTLLNSLRAARVTAEAASVALAVKSGGLAPADLIVAPAMLSVTTLLTESVLGKYMNNVKNELRIEQQRMVKAQLLEGIIGARLHSNSSNMKDDRLWGATLLSNVA
ncbi:MAG: GTPase domain-containing protein [Granulosicoccaceae bacterium]